MPAAFRTINGVRCKVALLDLGKKQTEAGPLQIEGARRIWESACDGNKVTETEKNTIRHIMGNYNMTDDARAFFDFWLQEKEVTKCSGAGVTVIDKVKCDGAMIEVAEIFKKRATPLSLRAAEGVWFCALDGKGVTKKEKDTLAVIAEHYVFEGSAKAFLDNKLQWLGIAQSAEERPAVGGGRVTIASDAIVLRTADALALATLPAPTQAIGNPLAIVPAPTQGTAMSTLPASSRPAPPASSAQTLATRPAPTGDKRSDGTAPTLRPEHLQLAVVKEERPSFFSWLSSFFSRKPAQKRKHSEDSVQETSAPKRQRTVDAPQIKLQELRQIFDKCDKDGDGFVSKREMIIACRQHPDIAKFFELPTTIRQEDGSRNAVEERFQSIDINSDRDISWAELLAYYRDQVVDI